MNNTSSPARRQRSTAALALEFLGSMNFAISLLMIVAVASVIGTVLQQNEPYGNYVRKFGPFWFEVFKSLGLFDVYSAGWFLVLLAFLVVSTSVCIWRNTPHMLRDMQHFRLDIKEKSLRSFQLHAEWPTSHAAAQTAQRSTALLAARGYRVRNTARDGHHTVAAMRGASGRLGYLLSHLAIVIICLGGLADGNLPLKFRELRGELRAETRDIPASEVPAESTLGVENTSFRGSVSIPEGGRSGVVFLQLRDGYLVQQLPFAIELEQFRVEYYSTGMPKSFESDLIIHDDTLDEPLHQTIRVNHPLIYKGYAIYQSSFGDGGTGLEMRAWPLDLPTAEPAELKGTVGRQLSVQTTHGLRNLEFEDFKMHNIFPVMAGDTSGKKFRNYGPSYVFRMRNEAGEALEYVNYMAPVELEGRLFYMSGMRSSVAEDYRYLYIPADPAGTPQRFMKLLASAQDGERVRTTIEQQLAGMIGEDETSIEVKGRMIESIGQLLELFTKDGFAGIVRFAEDNVADEEQRQPAINSYINVLQGVLGALYLDILRDEGLDVEQGIGEAESVFYDDTLNAMSILGAYGSPVYLQLTGFDHVESSGLQISRAPGKNIVYLGCAMLMIGVFMQFYIHQRRLWIHIRPDGHSSHVLFGGSGMRKRLDFTTEYEALRDELKKVLPPGTSDLTPDSGAQAKE